MFYYKVRKDTAGFCIVYTEHQIESSRSLAHVLGSFSSKNHCRILFIALAVCYIWVNPSNEKEILEDILNKLHVTVSFFDRVHCMSRKESNKFIPILTATKWTESRDPQNCCLINFHDKLIKSVCAQDADQRVAIDKEKFKILRLKICFALPCCIQNWKPGYSIALTLLIIFFSNVG